MKNLKFISLALVMISSNLFASNSAIVYSAGIETHGINPGAASIMKEDGVDISNNTSNHVDEYENIDFDFIS